MTQFNPSKGLIFFATVLLSMACHAKGSNSEQKTSFMLYFLPLSELGPQTTESYMSEVKALLGNGNKHSKAFEPFLVESQSLKKCGSQSAGACLHTLYGNKKCVPNNKTAAEYCFAQSRNLPQSFFKEPVFSRLKWNRFAIAINKICNSRNSNPVCQQLARLHDIYMGVFQKKRRLEKNKAKKSK